jgi:hypothetical protein
MVSVVYVSICFEIRIIMKILIIGKISFLFSVIRFLVTDL